MNDSVSIKLTCPDCGSNNVGNLSGPDDGIVSCQQCGKEFGTVKKVKAAIMSSVKKQATDVAKKTLNASIKKINRRR